MHRQHQSLADNIWETEPSTFPVLEKQEAHLWCANLESSGLPLAQFWTYLSKEEKDRSNLFRFEKDRISYITARGTLRKLLAGYLKISPSFIQFTYSSFGKPSLAQENQSLQFNISHSGGMGLFGFVKEAEIGVDIEQVKKEIEVAKLADRFFSKEEAKTILQLAPKDQLNSFFKCWTRKEAFIKGHGQGMSLPLDQFEVSILDGEQVALRRVAWDDHEAKEWDFVSFDVKQNFVGALTCRTTNLKQLRYFKL